MTTITQEQLNDHAERIGMWWADARELALCLGITIAPAEPPAEMVKLAREIVAKICDQQQQVREVMIGGWDDHAVMRAALAVLQHAVDVVQNTGATDTLALRATVLNALGAGGRDAG